MLAKSTLALRAKFLAPVLDAFDIYAHKACMVEWITADKHVPYPDALSEMEQRVAALIDGGGPETVWLLEHPSLYTAGTSADIADLVDPDRFPVFTSQRGGQYTYHGPGQRIAYAMLDLNARGKDVRKYVWKLEEWVIRTLAAFDVIGERRTDRVGVWVVRHDKPLNALGQPPEDKIAAIGVRLRKWVSFHGVSINLNPNLEHYSAIVPCGIAEHGVTSLIDLGHHVTMDQLDSALREQFEIVFEAEFNAPSVR
jgi:lipoyl(octanoyl) transferase